MNSNQTTGENHNIRILDSSFENVLISYAWEGEAELMNLLSLKWF